MDETNVNRGAECDSGPLDQDQNQAGDIQENGGLSSCDEHLVSAWVLTECREFLKRVFSCLTAKQLNVCGRVCTVWHQEARRTLARRQDLFWVSHFHQSHDVGDTSSHPLGFFGQEFERVVENAAAVPRFALMFTEFSKGSEYRDQPKAKRRALRDGGPQKSGEVMDYLKALLPRDCVLLSLLTPGTVAPKASDGTKPADESEDDGAAFCTFLPSMPGVDIAILPISPKLLQGGDKESLWQRWLEAGVAPADAQCVLLFGWGYISGVQQAAAELQRLFQEKAGRSPVIAGGIVSKLLSKGLCSKSEESSGAIGVMFSGPGVKAASVLLGENVQTREAAKGAIARLREANFCTRPQRSLGFMFACSGRGSHFYRDENVESEAFHAVFPDTPLFGFFGGGEIGCENLTLGREIDAMCLSKIAHAYTTIACLLTFDPS